MLSQVVERKAKSHLRLAEGFMGTAEIRDSASEYEIRNAFSRVYYALFHLCYAHLLGLEIDLVTVKEVASNHGRLHSSMRRPAGRAFERFLKRAYARRLQSDYNKPEWAVPAATVAQIEMKGARTQFYWLFHTTRNSLG
jgi:uncharacterized protein (UPF0332 family)